jgi:hypothetical protein
VGAAGVDAAGSHLEHPDGPTAHAVTTPAEDDGVYPTREDPLKQYLSLFLVKRPAKDEVHQAGRL